MILPTLITALTPACAPGAADVTVTNPDGGRATLGGGFVFTAGGGSSPTLTRSPAERSDAGGTTMTLPARLRERRVLTIDGAAAASVVVVNTTTITAVTPAGTIGAGDVVVANADTGSVTLPNGFTYNESPRVTSVTPSTGPGAAARRSPSRAPASRPASPRSCAAPAGPDQRHRDGPGDTTPAARRAARRS